MRSDFSRPRPLEPGLFQVLLDLLAPRAADGGILGGVPFDFDLTIGAGMQFVAKFPQSRREFRAVDSSGMALRPIELASLQGMGLPIACLSDVEDDGVRVQLMSRVPIHRPGAITLKLGGNHLAGVFAG